MADERKLKLATARLLLKQGQQQAARGVLQTMDDPTAAKWLEQLGKHKTRQRQWLRGLRLSALAVLLCLALGVGWLLGRVGQLDWQDQLLVESTSVYVLTATGVQPTADAIQSRNLTVEAILTTTATE